MKLTRIIETVFGTPARIAILRRLAIVSQPLSGRQLADLTGLSHRGVIQAIVPLVEAGIEAEIRDDLMEELVNNFAADTASLVLFGSFARGEESNISDVDILAIARTSREKQKVEEIGEIKAGAFREKYAAPLSLHCLTREELKSRSQSAFIKGVGREGTLLSGKPVEELMRGGKAKDQKRKKN